MQNWINNVDSGAGDVAQVVECLSSMLKALISYTEPLRPYVVAHTCSSSAGDVETG